MKQNSVDSFGKLQKVQTNVKDLKLKGRDFERSKLGKDLIGRFQKTQPPPVTNGSPVSAVSSDHPDGKIVNTKMKLGLLNK